MIHRPNIVFAFLIGCVLLLCAPPFVSAMTAQEILEQGVKRNLGESFRVALSVKTFKAKKLVSQQALWFMAKVGIPESRFFVDFVEPVESRGLRFLLSVREGADPQALMFIPSSGKTLPLAVDDPALDVGGTGLTMDDIQGLVPRDRAQASLEKEETVDGRDCHVIRVTLPEGKGARLLWVSKKDLFVVKSQQMDAQGQVKRVFRVVEFFKTEQGKEFPREEEILIPDKNIRIEVRQENAVFGIEIPDEVVDPEKFGTFKWQG
jgi:hypothetical protein